MYAISFCLWGNQSKYTVGAIRNAQLVSKIYPGWVAIFYIDDSVDTTVVNALKNLSAQVIYVPITAKEMMPPMLWRILPANTPDIEIFVVRDCDSRLTKREKAAVDEWLASSKGFHSMRDHPLHTAKIMGGMWGMKHNCVPNIVELAIQANLPHRRNADQEFLENQIYPLIKDNVMIHDEFHETNKPFPTKRIGRAFVGEVIDEFEQPREESRALIKPKYILL